MICDIDLVALAEFSLENPFERDRESLAQAEARLAAVGLDALAEIARNGRGKEARRIAVARALALEHIGTADHCGGREARLFRRFGLDPAAVQRVCRGERKTRESLAALAGTSESMRGLRSAVWRACFGHSVYEALRMRPLIREQNVLILGETGTGKELVARALAAAEAKSGEDWAVNAAAIPCELLESELFGHVKGAFTGAHGDRVGKVAAASGGAFFLDEIADLPHAVQAKLLRVLEDDRVTPIGSNTPIPVDVRYIGATSRPLDALVRDGAFRVDLYERLAGIVIEVPPLRERVEDLSAIADTLFERQADRLRAVVNENAVESTGHLSRLTAAHARFRAWLEVHGTKRRWSGNVRELENLVRRCVLGFEPGCSALPRRTPPFSDDSGSVPGEFGRFANGEATLKELEDWYIAHVFARCDNKQRRAARVLGIDRGTLARRLKRGEEVES